VVSGVTACTLDHAVLYAKWIPAIAATIAEAVDAPAVTFASGADAPAWFVTDEAAHTGPLSARSGVIGANGVSILTAAVTGPGVASFWWKADSESGFDFLSVSVNGGAPIARISGDTGWAFMQIPVAAAGPATLTWGYSKDGSVDSRSDCGFIDAFAFIPASASSVAITFDVNAASVPPVDGFTRPFGASFGTLPVLQRAGHLFAGWRDGNDTLVTSATLAAADTLLTAQWAAAGAWHFENDSDGVLFLVHVPADIVLVVATNTAGDVTVRGPAAWPAGVTVLPLADPLPAGYAVTAVSDFAFNNRRTLVTAALPATLATLGAGAFLNCPALGAVLFDGPPPDVVSSANSSSSSYAWSGTDFTFTVNASGARLYTETRTQTVTVNGTNPVSTVTTIGDSPAVASYVQPAHAAAWSAALESGSFASGNAVWQDHPVFLLGDAPADPFALWAAQFYVGPVTRTTLGANGVTLEDSYIAGLVPTNPASLFLAHIAIEGGARALWWTPDHRDRVYTVYGKTNLVLDASWQTPTNAAHRFFKVRVDMTE
ncbi:MAG: hypothetical protein LBW77_07720, partial [Verrucomicrobiota bacterium]|nr:hypothetical protein [Verrucomicrobiota bacterium]